MDAPPRRNPKKPKKPVKPDADSGDEQVVVAKEDLPQEPNGTKKPKKSIQFSPETEYNENTPLKTKKRKLAQSRQDWDDDELEVIKVPTIDESSESESQDHTIVPAKGGQCYFDDLPDEVVLHVFSFLDEVSLTQASAVSRRFRGLANNDAIWLEKSKNWENATIDPSAHGGKVYYTNKYSNHLKERDRKYKAAKHAASEARKDQLGYFWNACVRYAFFNRVMDYLTVIAAIIGTIFVVLRLDDFVDWNWRLVLLPFYVPMMQFALSITVFDVAQQYLEDRIDDESSKGEHVLWSFLFQKLEPWRDVLWFTIAGMLIFFILLMVKLNDDYSGILSIYTVIPLLLLAVIIAQYPVFGWGHGYCNSRRHMILNAMVAIVAILFIVLKLDNFIQWSWYLVLVPVWALFGMNFVYPIIVRFAECCSSGYWINDVSYLGGSDEFISGAMVVCFILILTPLLAWVALMAINIEGDMDRPWYIVFVPMFILEFIVLGGCVFLDIVYYCC